MQLRPYRQRVTFEPFGPDVSASLQKVGWICSTSDLESHAVALGEGMASGAIPVIFDRLGTRHQYASEWVHATADDAARPILELMRRRTHVEAERLRVAEYAAQWTWSRLSPVWEETLRLSARRNTV